MERATASTSTCAEDDSDESDGFEYAEVSDPSSDDSGGAEAGEDLAAATRAVAGHQAQLAARRGARATGTARAEQQPQQLARMEAELAQLRELKDFKASIDRLKAIKAPDPAPEPAPELAPPALAPEPAAPPLAADYLARSLQSLPDDAARQLLLELERTVPGVRAALLLQPLVQSSLRAAAALRRLPPPLLAEIARHALRGPGPPSQPRLVQQLRCVCRAWRAAIGYELVGELRLRRQQLVDVPWPTFGGVRRLALARTKLRKIPPQVAQLVRLEELDVCYCGLEDLPEWLTGLRLRRLDLGYNHALGSWLDDGPQWVQPGSTRYDEARLRWAPPTLRWLTLSAVDLNRLPPALAGLAELQGLELEDNPDLSLEGAEWLCELPALRALNLAACGGLLGSRRRLPAWVHRLRLAELDLSDAELDDALESAWADPELALLEALQPPLSAGLQQLSLSENDALEALPAFFGGGFAFLSLRMLSLAGCRELRVLPEYLPALPLTRLSVERCPLLAALPAGYTLRGSGCALLRLELAGCRGLVGEPVGGGRPADRLEFFETGRAGGSFLGGQLLQAIADSLPMPAYDSRSWQLPRLSVTAEVASRAHPAIMFVLSPASSHGGGTEWRWTAADGLHAAARGRGWATGLVDWPFGVSVTDFGT
jgi:hypothetical protein